MKNSSCRMAIGAGVLVLALAYAGIPAEPSAEEPPLLPVEHTFQRPVLLMRPGERITYDIRMGAMKLGSAEYHQEESVEIKGKKAEVIIFQTRTATFKDTETIYSDPETFLPLKIERDITKLLSQESITEIYDHKECKVVITKRVGKREETIVIQKDAPLQNALLLPFILRNTMKLSRHTRFTVTLPKASFQLTLQGLKDVRLPTGRCRALYFTSNPRQFEIWISADRRRIPLKIKGFGKIGYTFLLRKYQVQDNQGRE
ncbi:MAG: DUF3108 domain-containing protein [Candidatus Omnitrophica bacterium]|nr:DUF3108 domain-containing protein [Candidatus Omnitrophota bacterium]